MKRLIPWFCLGLLLTGCSPAPSQNQTPPIPANKQTAPTSAAAAQPTQGTQANRFQEVMVVDNEDTAIYITDFREDPIWGWVLDVFLENKSDEDVLLFSVDSASVNGVEILPMFSAQVAPGKKAKEQIVLSDTSLKSHDIGLYSDIALQFCVSDAQDWMEEAVARPRIHVYPYGAGNAVPYSRPSQPADQILANNEAVTVTVIGYRSDPIWGYTVELFLENHTDQRVMFSAENASVNGYMADPLYAASVGGGNCAFSTMSWSDAALEELGITQIEAVEFILRAVHETDWTAEDILSQSVILNPPGQ